MFSSVATGVSVVVSAALLDLITQLKEEFPHATIHGHNEFSAKACPCFDVKKELVPYFDKGSGK